MSKGWGAHPQVNVMSFGAQGDGIQDDSNAIQQAIDSLPSAGGTVCLPYGTFLVGSELQIYKQKVSVVGQGIGTIIQASDLTQNIFVLGDGNTTYADLALRHMKLTASGQKTSNTGIKLNKCFKVWIDDVFVEKQYRSMHILNTTQVWVTNCPIRDTKENGITVEAAINSGYDVYINNLVMDNPDVTNAGIGIEWLGGETLVMHGADIMRFVTGMNIDAATGKEARWGFFTGVILDTCSDNGLHIGNTGTGNVAGLTFTNCWTSTCTNYGLLVDKAGSGYVQGVRFIGHKAFNNGLAGIRIAGGSDVHVSDSDIVSNSATVSGARDGIEATANTSNWSVRGCRITNGYGHGDSQRWGVSVAAGASDYYQVIGNDLSGNVEAKGFLDEGTGTNKSRANNIPSGVTGELVLNPGAETGAVTNWNSSGAEATQDAVEFRSGAKSLHLVTSSGTGNWRSDYFAATASQAYRVRGFFKGDGGAQVFLTIRWFSGADGTTFISEDNIAIADNYADWTEKASDITAPGSTQSADIMFRVADTDTADIYGDDFSVRATITND